MLGLKLRDEFKGRRLRGTAIELTNKNNTGATQIPTADSLKITYPSTDLLKTLEAAGPVQGRPVTLIGERGQGKSHLMAVLFHALTAFETLANEAEQAVDSEMKNVETAQASLRAKNPEKIKALAETAESSLITVKERHGAAQTELTEVQTRLKIHGEEGLHEKLQAAKAALETVEANNRSLFRRAAAVRLLHDIMCQERDRARQAYVAPLKDRVERLGRLVFDQSFRIELDDNLQIINRTTGAITVPFDSLSGGTQGQLSLIFRLACSMIVAEDEGMPLIMDDALGYTDPERLRLMGAVLAKAAKECQIVIFTCIPERYGNIGAAVIVSL